MEYRKANDSKDGFYVVHDGPTAQVSQDLVVQSVQPAPWGYEEMSFFSPTREWLEKNSIPITEEEFKWHARG